MRQVTKETFRLSPFSRRRLLVNSAAFGVAAFAGRRGIAAPSISPVMATLSAYMSEAGARDASRRSRREGQASHPGYAGRDGLGIAAARPDASRSISRGCIRARKSRLWRRRTSCAVRSKQRSPTRCWRIRTKPTTRTRPRSRIPGCSIVPAALAAAEQFGIDGQRFLRAVTLGYDVGTRVTMTVGVPGFQSANHLNTHAIAGTFGSAAAAASRPASTRSRCAGCSTTPRSRPPASKPGSATPITSRKPSSLRACRRATASRQPRSCTRAAPASTTFFRGRTISCWSMLPRRIRRGSIEKLGERYEIARTNIKKWTVGSPIQAPLDALENIRQEASVRGRAGEDRRRARGHQRGRAGEQSRDAGHLPAAHGGGDAGGQDGVRSVRRTTRRA